MWLIIELNKIAIGQLMIYCSQNICFNRWIFSTPPICASDEVNRNNAASHTAICQHNKKFTFRILFKDEWKIRETCTLSKHFFPPSKSLEVVANMIESLLIYWTLPTLECGPITFHDAMTLKIRVGKKVTQRGCPLGIMHRRSTKGELFAFHVVLCLPHCGFSWLAARWYRFEQTEP